MDIVTLDFETFYGKDFTLSKMTYNEYVRDPRFEVIGVGIKRNGGPTKWVTGDSLVIKAALEVENLRECAVLAHNAPFDMSILNWVYNIIPKRILDTLSMARAIHGIEVGNSLSKLVKHYELGEKGDEVVNAFNMKRLDFGPRQMAAYGRYCINDCDLTYGLFFKLLPHFSKLELQLIDMTIRMLIDGQFVLNQQCLEDHLVDVISRKATLLLKAGMGQEALRSNLQFANVLENLGVEPPMKLSATTGKMTYAFAKTDEGMKELLEHPNEAVRAVVEARIGVKTSIEETRTQKLIEVARMNVPLPIGLKYYGATTGRWSADQGLNLQNIPRKSRMREAISAPDGHVIVGVDLSNIELRVGMFLAGEPEPLANLAAGLDLYRDFGSKIYLVPPEEITDEQRFISKTAVLALIYGVGANKLHDGIKKMGGIDIGLQEANRIVQLYRALHTKVLNGWSQSKNAIRHIASDQTCIIGGGSLLLEVHGKRGVLLPSGMYMQYPDLRNDAEPGESVSWVYGKDKTRLYPAKLFQNVTQAVARCVMAEAMPRIAKRYRIALTVHDAIYCIVPEHEGQVALDFIIKEMTTAPQWAWGLPLAAEGAFGKTLADLK